MLSALDEVEIDKVSNVLMKREIKLRNVERTQYIRPHTTTIKNQMHKKGHFIEDINSMTHRKKIKFQKKRIPRLRMILIVRDIRTINLFLIIK